jgi:hypothetical protein
MSNNYSSLPSNEDTNLSLKIPPSDPQEELELDLSKILLENVNIPSYHLSESQINWINQFISASPESFNKITEDIQKITNTQEFGLQNIPEIIHLCADVYKTESLKNGLSNPEMIISFIKFTLDVILSSQYNILPDFEKELLRQLVDNSMNLLIFNLGHIENIIDDIEPKNCCFKFFHF